jgi:hypothetical protein
VIENDLDPNQALILANQNQPKAIKPYDLSRALAPLIDIEARKLASVHQKIDEDGQNDATPSTSLPLFVKVDGYLIPRTFIAKQFRWKVSVYEKEKLSHFQRKVVNAAAKLTTATQPNNSNSIPQDTTNTSALQEVSNLPPTRKSRKTSHQKNIE